MYMEVKPLHFKTKVYILDFYNFDHMRMAKVIYKCHAKSKYEPQINFK